MSSRQLQFEAMLALQHRMNSKVHPEWFKQGFAYYRALWIECAELMEHHGYKWWKKQSPDLEQVRLEIVDIWHFGLSMLIDGRDFRDIAIEMEQALHDYENPNVAILVATETLAQSTLSSRQFSVAHFWSLLQSADMDADDLYRMYVGKNVLNFFRQDHGYKEGSYVKLWSGREDNEHLVDISGALNSGSADYEQALYTALEKRYQQVLEGVER